MGRPAITEFEQKLRETISNNLKRITYGYTQAQVSEMTGIPASTLSGYFAKRSTIKRDNLKKIAEAFNVKESDIDPRAKEKIDWSEYDKQLTPKHFELIKEAEELDLNPKALTVAAHIDDDTSEEELDEIMNYIKFKKSQRKKEL
ncbi:helix-turn-helix domain-containing protein [Enterococcus sp. LJL128]